MSAKTEACWDRTEGCCMTDAFERRMKPKPKRTWGDVPGLIRLSRFGDGWIVACRLCPKSNTGAPRNFAWPKGDLLEAIGVLSGHFRDEHPLRFGISDECPCAACDPGYDVGFGFRLATRMSVCPDCGNKRCPKAANHAAWQCSGSNEPGQVGVRIDATSS